MIQITEESKIKTPAKITEENQQSRLQGASVHRKQTDQFQVVVSRSFHPETDG